MTKLQAIIGLVGALLLGVGLGWAINPGVGMAAFGTVALIDIVLGARGNDIR